MALIEHSSEERLRREDAAQRLRDLADELSRHNEVSFVRDGQRFTVDVPDEVTLSLEIEVGGDENEIEIELTW
jgi:amphi-Trp domain-containing protein